MIVIETLIKQALKPDALRCNWRNCTPAKLQSLLQETNWQINYDSVQAYWNTVECKLIEIIDALAPWKKFHQQTAQISPHPIISKAKSIKETGS